MTVSYFSCVLLTFFQMCEFPCIPVSWSMWCQYWFWALSVPSHPPYSGSIDLIPFTLQSSTLSNIQLTWAWICRFKSKLILDSLLYQNNNLHFCTIWTAWWLHIRTIYAISTTTNHEMSLTDPCTNTVLYCCYDLTTIVVLAILFSAHSLPTCCCRSSMWACCSGRSHSWKHPWSTLWRATPEFTRQPSFTSLHMSCAVHNKMHICTHMWVCYCAPSYLNRTATLMCIQITVFFTLLLDVKLVTSAGWRSKAREPSEQRTKWKPTSWSITTG